MIFDGREVAEGATIRTPVCIVGAGVAGIIIARELDRAGIGVCVLESGGFDLDADTQALYRGRSLLPGYHALDASRLRLFGGSSNHWTGWTRPLDPLDFIARDWIADSGWPIDRETLDPFYREAQGYFQLGGQDWDVGSWEMIAGKPFFANTGEIETGIARHSPPTRFGPVWGGALNDSRRSMVFLHSNVVDIRVNEAATAVDSVRVKTLRGNAFDVDCEHLVLATGGIENARLMLACNSQVEKGLGNGNDLVGRFFADHVGSTLGRVAVTRQLDRVASYGTFSLRRNGQSLAYTAGLKLTAQAQVKGKLANFGTLFFDVPTEEAGAQAPLVMSGEGDYLVFDVGAVVEPLPFRDSRVRLDQDRDALGLPKTVLDYRFHPDQTAQVKRAALQFIRHWGLSLGRGALDADFSAVPDLPAYGDHHMGTTRMHANPRHGVVDADCKVHGMSNFFVAGSSVFPTYGFAQPTFTIGALSLRLAAHLQSVVRA